MPFKGSGVMSKSPWPILAVLLIFGSMQCSEKHSLPAKFHENRIGTPEELEARLEGDDVVLEWNIRTPPEVFYYIVTLSAGTSGAEWKYTAPGDRETYTVEFAWIDSFYTFHLQAVDTTDFVGERSNVDTVFIQ
jgi:hypothetical protein